MLTSREVSSRVRRAALVLLLPVAISGCITIESDLVTPPPTAAAGSASPAASASTAPTPSPVPTPPPTPEPVEAEVLAFVPYWQLASAAESIDPTLVTVAAFHSVEAAQDGSLVAKKPNGDVPAGWSMLGGDAFAELKPRLQAAGIKVVPVIQRTAWTEGTRARMVNLLTRGRNRRALVENVTRLVRERGFDGVNLDFEPVPAGVADEYLRLVQELRAALDAVDPGLHLSIDVLPSLEGLDLAGLTADDAADLAVIMGYNYRTAAAGTTGSTAPLVSSTPLDLTSTVAAALAQVEGERLLLALPWYGLAWSTASDEAGADVRRGEGISEGATVDYAVAVEQAIEAGRRYDPEQASAWTAYASKRCADCPSTWRQVWYDDPDSFGTKVDLALDAGLAGVGLWAAGMEAGRGELWSALGNRLRPLLDEAPPNGSPALDPDTVQGDMDGRPVVAGSAVLRLFASDEADGSGLGFVRVGLDGALDPAGMLATGRTYPASERIEFPLGDEETGGSPEEGPRSIHVQWRDLAGNWSQPVVLEAWAVRPATTPTPADLG